MNADGTNQVQLTFTDNTFDGPASWSPDGARILFQEAPPMPALQLLQLFLMNPDGTGVTQLTFKHHDRDQNAYATWGVLRVDVKPPKETQPARAPAAAPVPKR